MTFTIKYQRKSITTNLKLYGENWKTKQAILRIARAERGSAGLIKEITSEDGKIWFKGEME